MIKYPTPEERHWREALATQLGEELAEKHLNMMRELIIKGRKADATS